MTADEWIAAFAQQIGVDAPTQAEVGELLELAAEAAHSSERIAAPLACYLAGRSGAPVSKLRVAAGRITE